MALTKYQKTLQSHLSFDDSKWEYVVSGLPQAAAADQAGLVKTCNLTASTLNQGLFLSYTRIQSNRALSLRPLNHFINLLCADFRLQAEDGSPRTLRESAEYLSRLLKSGIELNGTRYSFYGHSNSQLKSRSCYLMAGSPEEVEKVVESLGDFSKMKTAAKKAKRIGLMFSTAHAVVTVLPERCRDIADVERDGYVFTDGCGSISTNLAHLLSQKRPILFRNKRYHPSVFQIRYRGYKGVVIIEPKIKAGTQLELRRSMRKFSGGNDNSFAVVEYSKPFTYGFLNDETVLLLDSLGISQEVLSKKQQEHLDFLKSADRDATSAFRFLSAIDETQLAEKVLLDGLEDLKKQVRKKVSDEYAKLFDKRGERKCRILIPKSRLLFGVCDPYGILREGECFVKPTMESDGVPHALDTGIVLVARNPCLHPGDLQKLRVVARHELAHLTDCIVFATQGSRPSADMMSGGDLDGDKFFVTWDSEIIPSNVSEAAEYPAGKEPVQFARVTTHDRIEYFAHSSNMQLGRIKKLYLRWARIKGPLSAQCQELNRLFSQCVDADRVKIPERLLNPEEPSSPQPVFILDALHQLAIDYISSQPQAHLLDESTSQDALLGVLTESNTLSQFDLIKLTYHWCHKNNVRFSTFRHYFDYTSLSSEEKTWVASLLPPGAHDLDMVYNDLMHSSILSPKELAAINLRNASIRWKCVFRSPEDPIARVLTKMDEVFPYITRKLLVFQVHDRLSVAIYLPKTILPSDDFPIGQTGKVLAFPHRKGDIWDSRVVVPTKHNAHFVYDRNGFQLFEGKRANTFIFFTRSQNDDSKYRNVSGQGRQARLREETIREGINYDWRTSIALNKFNQNLAKHIGRLHREGIVGAELYIISNRDTRSMRNLDLWLEHIDTDYAYQNFRYEDDPAPRLGVCEWKSETNAVSLMAKERDFSLLASTATEEDVARVLDLAWLTHDYQLAAEVVTSWVNQLRLFSDDAVRKLKILEKMIRFLVKMPQLVIYFVNLCPWSQLDLLAHEFLLSNVISLIKALVLCADSMGNLIVGKLKTLLEEVKLLNFHDLGSIITMVALTVKQSEIGADILLEAFQGMATRLLIETPKASEHIMKLLTGVAIDYIEERENLAKVANQVTYHWKFEHAIEWRKGAMILTCDYRIDAPQSIRPNVGDHLRFVCVQAPTNLILTRPASFDALVETCDAGQIVLQCLKHPPSFYQKCAWEIDNCCSFVTSRVMIEAVTTIATQKEECCEVYATLFASQRGFPMSTAMLAINQDSQRLNESQNQAVSEALAGPTTCIWGPPGTGKTHTIISIVEDVLDRNQAHRLLVTAPTHNAVDNVMRQYVKLSTDDSRLMVAPLRVSTDVRRVSADLRKYTCDAMFGKNINEHSKARRQAQKRISESRLIFSTCIGAGLGLLRNENFENVIVDEASQQSEPASLVPLIKNTKRIILVGDHVQLRPTVQSTSQALGYDVSLFERLWSEPAIQGRGTAIRRVMLDTQYRMHPEICNFPSEAFYESRLRTAVTCEDISVPSSDFPWPSTSPHKAFIQTSAPEDRGNKSKSNTGQSKVCEEVIRRLRCSDGISTSRGAEADGRSRPQPQNQGQRESFSISILTPYVRQAQHLQKLLPDEKVSSIDGYQGQEADVIVYVTVRCNPHREIGFLKDMRRLNVALTRAKAGLIIIGDEATLIGQGKIRHDKEELGEEEEEYHRIWKHLIQGMGKVPLKMDRAG